jgi:hypothetical protein
MTTATDPKIQTQIRNFVTEALNNATHENGYPHEYQRTPEQIAAEIHDWSGIEGYDHEDPRHIEIAALAVKAWRGDQIPNKRSRHS